MTKCTQHINLKYPKHDVKVRNSRDVYAKVNIGLLFTLCIHSTWSLRGVATLLLRPHTQVTCDVMIYIKFYPFIYLTLISDSDSATTVTNLWRTGDHSNLPTNNSSPTKILYSSLSLTGNVIFVPLPCTGYVF